MTAKPFAFTALAPLEWGMLALGFVLVAAAAYFLGRRAAARPEPIKAASPPSPAAGSRSRQQAETDVITFLGLLQEKGRLIDFLMDDVTGYTDAQVGSAARVVHQGCRTVLKEHLTIQPISDQQEGQPITLPQGYAAGDFRLLGNVSGEPPYQGVLVHKGWKASEIRLPRTVGRDGTPPPIAAAQVELS